MKISIICFICILTGMFLVIPVTAGEVPDSTESGIEEQADETLNQRVINNVTNELGSYWSNTSARLSGGGNVEGSLGYRIVMTVSNVCKRLNFFVSPLAIVVGIVIQLISGMQKTWKRTGVVIMIGVPTIMQVLAYGVPIAASIFYYGT